MGEPRKLHTISGTAGVVDQVLRREAFHKDYPSVTILSPRALGGSEWLASWEEENGSMTITRSELRDILDILDQRFPPKTE